MMYKVKEWPIGVGGDIRAITDLEKQQLEDQIFLQLKDKLPVNVFVVKVDVKVEYSILHYPGSIKSFFYKVEIPLEVKKEEEKK